jgi:hypothetical protein
MFQVLMLWGTALLLWILAFQADWLPLTIIAHVVSIWYLLVGLIAAIRSAREDD